MELIKPSPPVDIRNRDLMSIDSFIVRPEIYREDLKGILITWGEIQGRIDKMVEDISLEYHPHEFFALGIMDGAMKFFNEIVHNRYMWAPCEIGTIHSKSYCGTESSEEQKLGNFDFERIRGKKLVIFDDISDTFRTLDGIIGIAKKYNPSSIEVACMLDKREKRLSGFENKKPDYCGFIIPDLFVVGYGMDFDDKYRSLNHLCVLKKEIYENS